jgi:arylsulfatase A-like enzyme
VQRVSRALRSSLGILLLGAVIGTVLGAARGIGLAAENDYWAQGLVSLARWTILRSTVKGMQLGALGALIVLMSVALLWPFARLILGDWRRGLLGAVLAIPLIAAWLLLAWYANRALLPNALSPTSIAGNLVLAAGIATLWYFLLRLIERRHLAPLLARATDWARPKPLMLALLVLVAAQSIPAIVAATRNDQRPHVLLIVVDALRYDRLGAYGYGRDTSPNLDRLASEAWLFTNATAVAPWTKPSIASLLTGVYPISHGISSASWNRSDEEGIAKVSVLSRKLVTLPELLANAGYRTAAFGENHHLLGSLGFDQGFEVQDMTLGDSNALQSLARRLNLGVAGRLKTEGAGHLGTAHAINEHFLDWLPDADEPSFAYLHHINVHWPYAAPSPHAGRFGPRRTSVDFNSQQFYAKFGPERAEHDAPPAIDPAVLQDMSDAYDEGISFVDAELGALFAELKRLGRYDQTLIIVTADHGEQFLEHGEIGHGSSLHEVLLHVPLLIKFPCPGPHCQKRTIDEAVQLIDLMPTILDVLGLESRTPLAGDSMVRPIAERVLFAEKGEEIALRARGYKLIYNLEDATAELYALRNDPDERNNLADSEPDLQQALRDHLFQWLEERRRNPMVEPGQDVVADDEMLERLKALGYVK